MLRGGRRRPPPARIRPCRCRRCSDQQRPRMWLFGKTFARDELDQRARLQPAPRRRLCFRRRSRPKVLKVFHWGGLLLDQQSVTQHLGPIGRLARGSRLACQHDCRRKSPHAIVVLATKKNHRCPFRVVAWWLWPWWLSSRGSTRTCYTNR